MTIRLLWLITSLMISQNVPLFAQTTPAQRQRQQQQYQQRQQQQQQRQSSLQRQAQIQQRQQRFQQLQYKQQQLQQQRQTLLLKKQALDNKRQTMTKPGRPNLTTGGFGGPKVVVRKTVPATVKSGQTASGKQGNAVGRSRALVAVSKPTVPSSVLRMQVPPARSPQVLQAKADLRTNKLDILRANRQKSSNAQIAAGGTGARPPGGPPVAANDNRAIIAGKGSTVNPAEGRFNPRNVRERLAIEQAISKPEAGRVLPLKMNDDRWKAEEGWVKMQQTVSSGAGQKSINVHYVRNTQTGRVDDFKIVDTPQK